MAKPIVGEVVVIPFPQTDLQAGQAQASPGRGGRRRQ